MTQQSGAKPHKAACFTYTQPNCHRPKPRAEGAAEAPGDLLVGFPLQVGLHHEGAVVLREEADLLVDDPQQ